MDYLTMAFLSMAMIGFNTFAVKLLSAHLHPGLLVVSKFGAGLIGLLIYLQFAKIPLVWDRYFLYGCLIGVWWSGIMVLYYTAIARGPVSVVIPIFNLGLVIPSLLGFIFLHEALTVSKVLGLGFACAALVLLSR